MSNRMNKTLVAAMVAALAAACAGPVGPQGEPGAAGPAGQQGPGFEAGSSLSLVTPSWVVVGGDQTVQISGFATHWKSGAPTVSFGDGVTVNNVTVASDTALLVDVTVASDASPGTRTVTVTSGDETASYESAFQVKPVLEYELFGTTTQASLNTIRIVSNDPRVRLPTTAADLEFEGPANAEVSGGLWTVLESEILVYVYVPVTAPTGALDATVTLFPGDPNERALSVPLNITAAAPVNVEAGTPATGQLTRYASQTFKLTAAPEGMLKFDVQSSATGVVDPMFVVTAADGSVVAESATPFFVNSAPGEFFVIVWSNAGQTGAFTLDVRSTADLIDTEPNNTPETAQVFSSLPAGVVNGKVSKAPNADVADYFKFTVSASAVGQKLLVKRTVAKEQDADFVVELLNTDGTTSIGESGNLYEPPDTFTFPAFTAAGDYYVKIKVATVDGALGYAGSYGVELSLVP